jgi:hypothetical protein
MKTQFVLSLALTVVTSSCAGGVHTSTTRLDPSMSLAKTCPLGVKLYTAPDRVLHPYREVALLNSTADVTYSDEGELFDSMREQASKVGANGIIIGGIDEPNAITKVGADVAKTGALRKGRALAIYVPADSAAAAAACANYKAPSWLRRHLSF